ncbi:TlpA family protein disulfide reductase [Natronorubrum sp. DTA7]|uniref:TlpA family protein disulfide reductase n=1 Tax=Natronorubrum sp. DTA7 TaxID=3447016 RepID=UPI003F84E49B
MTPTGRNVLDRRTVLTSIGAGSLSALAGCTGDDDGGNDEESHVEPEAVDVDESATWLTASVTDELTGDEFAIGELERPVVVHRFTIGCAVCHSQHYEFDEFDARGNADAEIVDLTIDPRVSSDDLQSYAAEDGFEWRFGVSSEAMSGSLVSDFGQEMNSSTASPILVVCPTGETYRFDKIADAAELESVIDDVC